MRSLTVNPGRGSNGDQGKPFLVYAPDVEGRDQVHCFIHSVTVADLRTLADELETANAAFEASKAAHIVSTEEGEAA